MPLNPEAGTDGRQDLLGKQAPWRVAPDLQYGQTDRGVSYPFKNQPLKEIARVTHDEVLLKDKLSCK